MSSFIENRSKRENLNLVTERENVLSNFGRNETAINSTVPALPTLKFPILEGEGGVPVKWATGRSALVEYVFKSVLEQNFVFILSPIKSGKTGLCKLLQWFQPNGKYYSITRPQTLCVLFDFRGHRKKVHEAITYVTLSLDYKTASISYPNEATASCYPQFIKFAFRALFSEAY